MFGKPLAACVDVESGNPPPAMQFVAWRVLREILVVFFAALGVLTLFMLGAGLLREAQEQGLGMMQIPALVPYVLPEALRFAVPATMLFAVASVFGRMSARNEITALKAAGITPMATIWPAVGHRSRTPRGSVPPFAAWLGNLVLALGGFWLVRGLMRTENG